MGLEKAWKPLTAAEKAQKIRVHTSINPPIRVPAVHIGGNSNTIFSVNNISYGNSTTLNTIVN